MSRAQEITRTAHTAGQIRRGGTALVRKQHNRPRPWGIPLHRWQPDSDNRQPRSHPGARQMSRTDEQARAHTARRKLAMCTKLAREARRDSWQEPKQYRSEYHRISREAMEDARYWRDEIRKLDNQEPDR